MATFENWRMIQGMIQIRIGCVINYVFRMHYVIWAIFKMAAFKKMTNTKDIMTTK